MAALITERFGTEVETTATRKTGEFSVWVSGERVVNKYLPFIKPSDQKVLRAMEAALG